MMTSYKSLYFYLFGVIADAVEYLERGEVIPAMQRLIQAQEEAEDRILEIDMVPEIIACRKQDYEEGTRSEKERILRLAQMGEEEV